MTTPAILLSLFACLGARAEQPAPPPSPDIPAMEARWQKTFDAMVDLRLYIKTRAGGPKEDLDAARRRFAQLRRELFAHEAALLARRGGAAQERNRKSLKAAGSDVRRTSAGSPWGPTGSDGEWPDEAAFKESLGGGSPRPAPAPAPAPRTWENPDDWKESLGGGHVPGDQGGGSSRPAPTPAPAPPTWEDPNGWEGPDDWKSKL